MQEATEQKADFAAYAKASSAQGRESVGLRTEQNQLDQVLDIVLAGLRSGAKDMTRQEIRVQWERRDGKRHDASQVAARVNGLLSQSRLVQYEAGRRMCTITQRMVIPVTAPVQQARMF